MKHPALREVEHRPWPLPPGAWRMAQTWHDVLFAHWPVRPEVLSPHVPEGLELDLRHGEAWIGVVPFRMSGVRVRCLPPVPGAGAFPELNVRTYVRAKDRPGVLFLSLDAASRLAVVAARRAFHLPYFNARMRCTTRGDSIDYTSERTHRGAPAAHFEATYTPTAAPAPAAEGTLEHFLAERYRLYTTNPRHGICAADIHHRPWPLQSAAAELRRNTCAHASVPDLPLDPTDPPHLLFARRIDVVVWPLRPLDACR